VVSSPSLAVNALTRWVVRRKIREFTKEGRMDQFIRTYFGNDKTTGAGIVGLACVIAAYFMPEFKELLVTVAMSAFGVGHLMAKDADTGSKPGEKPPTPTGGSAMKSLLVLFTTLATLAVLSIWPSNVRAQDAPFGWSEKPIYITYDHLGYSTQLTALDGNGGAYRAVIGPIGQATLGANKLELGLLSAGVGVTTQPDTNQPVVGGQVGFVPGCTDNRGICLEIGAQKVNSQTPDSSDHDYKYMGSLLFRLSQLSGGAVPVTSATPVAARYLPTFAGLNRIPAP
jgi:hypothetical protein